MASRRLRTRSNPTQEADPTPSIASSRPRRAAAPTSSLSIERTSPEEPRQSIKLTVKAPPSKLREVTNSSSSNRGRNITVNSRDSFEGGEIVVGSRPRKKPIVEESSEDEEEDPEPNDEEEDEDAEGEEDDDMGEDEDEDAEGEEDEEMVDAPALHPPLPYKHPKGPVQGSKPSVKITAPLPSVEDKEMALDDDDDEELSDVPSADEDAEGEPDEEDGLGEEDAEGEIDDFDSDEELVDSGSRSHTPDPSKMTRRQRHELDGGQLMALSNEAQKKKHLTAEEHAMRRAEMARRRKNLSEKRNEEEKVCTRHSSYSAPVTDAV